LLGSVALLAPVATTAADAITLSTPYPAVGAAPGAKVSFAISVKTATAGRVDLAVTTVPDWEAVIHGGGFVVDGVQTDGTAAVPITLDITVPADAQATTQHFVLTATKGGDVTRLPLDVRVAPTAAGSVSLTTDFPSLKGASDQTFSFNLTLTNDTPDDLTFGVVAAGPDGWTVTAQLTSQSQAATILVKAGSNTTISVSVKPSTTAGAGTFPITVDATSGDQKAHADLSVEITGSYALTMTTPTGALNTSATAGAVTDLTLTLKNTGTADIPDVALTADAPTGWTVKFDPPTITVPANPDGVNVTAHLTPSGDAIAGDYVATMRAASPLASTSADIRVTIETSLLWGAVGVGLIVLVLVGLWWTFRRYGRR
jgi:uncharacterized membrane protein